MYYSQGPANKYISLRDRRSRRGDTIFGAKFSIRLFRYYIKFLNKENMHTYSYGVLLYSDGRMPPLVALFADLYQFCTRYVKSNNDLCSADVLTIARNTRQVNTSAEHRSLLLVSCPPFSTYGLGVRYICSLAPVVLLGRQYSMQRGLRLSVPHVFGSLDLTWRAIHCL